MAMDPTIKLPAAAQKWVANLRNALSDLRGHIMNLQHGSAALGHPVKGNQSVMARWGSDIRDAAQRYGVSPSVLANLINAESGGNPNARSPVGAYGLTQIMPATARSEGLSVATPRDQIFSGAKYLSKLMGLTGGDVRRALAAYNAGPGRLKNDAWMRISETRNYVKKILG